MDNRSKIEAILTLIKGDLEEVYFFVNQAKIQQQILSEILYLFEKIEKNKVTTGYINRRIKNCTKNCIQSGWLIPRTKKEINVEYLENLSWNQEKFDQDKLQLQNQKNKTTKKTKTRRKGWHKKTERRLEHLLTGTSKNRKKREYVVQPLLAAVAV